MRSVQHNDDERDNRTFLGSTVQDNGDLTADFLDESGEVVTEVVKGYMPAIAKPAPAEPAPAQADGPEGWSDYWDLYTWELSDPCEVADLMAAAINAEIARRDAPPEPWPTAEEIAEFEAEIADATDRRERVFSDWIASNLRQQVSPEEISQFIAHGAI
jgi:hypothetical protein